MKPTLKPSRASDRLWRPNLFVYGEAGTGKTMLALELARLTGAKTLFIDTEESSAPYRVAAETDADLWWIDTDDPGEIEAQIDALSAEPDGFTFLVLDSVSPFFASRTSEADEEVRIDRARKKQAIGRFNRALDVSTLGIVKSYNARFSRRLRRLDMARLVTARSKPKWESTGGGGLRRTGSTWEGDQSLEYEFDVVLEILKTGGERRVVRVEKSRGFEWGEQFEVRSPRDFADILLSAFGHGGFLEASDPRPVVTDEQAAEIRRLVEALELAPESISRSLRRHGASSIEELPRAAGDRIVEALSAKLAAAEAESTASADENRGD